MKSILLALILALPVAAHGADWKVDPAASHIGFSGDFDGDAFQGVFTRFDASIRFDPADLEDARFDVTIDLASVDTQASERDDTLREADFFNVKRTPKAHFTTQGFRTEEDGTVVADGTLAMNGITHPVTLRVHFAAAGTRATLKVATRLDRLDWKLGTGSDWSAISTTIPVEAKLALTRAAP